MPNEETYGEQIIREVERSLRLARYHEQMATWHEQLAAGRWTEKPKRPSR